MESHQGQATPWYRDVTRAIKEFNNLVSVPPTSFTNSLFYHHDKMTQWALDDAEQKAVEKAPAVAF